MAWGRWEPPRRSVAIAMIAAVAAVGAAAPADGAVTRAQAQKVAERSLRNLMRSGDARLFAIPRPLRRGSVVTEGGIPNNRLRSARRRGNTLRARVRGYRVRRAAYMFWLDQAPGGGFQKPSITLLVDRQSGRIVHRRSMSWWPVVNRRRIHTPDVGRRPRAVPPPAWSAAIVTGLRDDCIVTIGDRTDPYFLKGLAAVTARGQALGMRVAGARTVSDLGPTIDRLARGNPPCTDVMIYIAAHGWGPMNSDVTMPNGDPIAKSEKARVTVKSTVGGGANPTVVEENLDFDDVKKIIHDRPNLTFKLAVESCFSGRWTLLMAEPNLRITLTSARSSEVTFLAVTHAQKGTQSKGEIHWDDSAPVGTPDGPGDPPPFTKGLVQALDQWSESPTERAKGEDLGEALGYAGEHREGDRARGYGWQHGVTDDRTDQRPHAPTGQPPPQQPPGQVAYEVTVTGTYRHIGPGSSEVCWDIRTIPPRPEAQVTIRTSGPGVVNGGSQSLRLDDNGFARVRVSIDQYGAYSGNADVVATDGAARSDEGNVTVSAADGTCPPG